MGSCWTSRRPLQQEPPAVGPSKRVFSNSQKIARMGARSTTRTRLEYLSPQRVQSGRSGVGIPLCDYDDALVQHRTPETVFDRVGGHLLLLPHIDPFDSMSNACCLAASSSLIKGTPRNKPFFNQCLMKSLPTYATCTNKSTPNSPIVHQMKASAPKSPPSVSIAAACSRPISANTQTVCSSCSPLRPSSLLRRIIHDCVLTISVSLHQSAMTKPWFAMAP